MNLKTIVLFLITTSFFIGCATTGGEIDTRAKLKTASEKNINDVDIKLPPRYDIDEFHTPITLRTTFEQTSNPLILQMQRELETKMMNVKRFKTYSSLDSQHQQSNDRDLQTARERIYKEQLDRSEMGLEKSTSENQRLSKTVSEIQVPDYKLSIVIANNAERQNYKANADEVVRLFTVSVDTRISNAKDGEVDDNVLIKGLSKRYTLYRVEYDERLKRNIRIPNKTLQQEELENKSAYLQAASRAGDMLMNALGNKFPAGGKVIAINGNDLQINSGLADGVLQDQIMVIFTNVGGIDVPIALAKVIGLQKRSAPLEIIKWSDKPKAEEIREKLKNGQIDFHKQSFYAVARLMPPPEFPEDSFE